MLISQDGLLLAELPPESQPTDTTSYVGHPHFWERALSRRQVLGAAAGVTGAIAASNLWMPVVADAHARSGLAPKPIPGGVQTPFRFIHHFPMQPGNDPSQITDFKGFIGVAQLAGTGTGIDTKTGKRTPLLFDIDNRFMKGVYVGVDGRRHTGTFAFI